MSRRPRVALVRQHIDVGGAEELIAAYTRGLPRRGFDVATVCLTRKGRIAREIEQSGAPLWFVPGEPGPRDPRAFLRLVHLLRRAQPDVVHTFLLVGSLYGRLAAALAGIPVIVATEANVYERKSLRHVWLERALSRATYRVIASSYAVQRFASRQTWMPVERMPVLYNAIDFGMLDGMPTREAARASLEIGQDELVVGTIARLTEQKGHRFLLDAVARLAGRFPTLHLVVVGDGPLESALREQAARLGIAGQVRFLGVRRDLATLYAAFDVFAIASLWEGLPLALLSAMAAALPVVATAVGGTVEAMDDGESGLLVPAGDAEALARALECLLADRDRRARLGAEARRRARARFGLEAHLDALATLYRAGLRERGSVVG